MSGRVLWSRVQNYLFVGAGEVGVEVEGVAVQNCRLANCVRKLQMYCLQVLQRAAFKVKLFAERLACQRFLRVVSVQNRLLELLTHRFLVQAAEVKSVEVSSFPKLRLLKLLVINGLIRERHDTEIGFGREEASAGFEEHVTRNDVSLKHPLVE